MDTQKFLTFFALMSFFLIVIDLYILRSWRKYVIRRNWDKMIYIFPFITAIIFALFRVYAIYSRSANEIPNDLILIGERLATIWYLPKIVIIPFIVIKDLIHLADKLFRKKSIPQTSEIKPTNRREFMSNVGWAIAGVPFIMVTDGLLRSTYNFKVYDIEIPIWNLPPELDGLKIIQLSDIHAGSFASSKPFHEVRMIIKKISPDLVFMTGDFVNFQENEIDKISFEMKQIEAEYGVFACLGNHDHYMFPKEHEIFKSKIRSYGIDLLVNENRTLDIRGNKIQIAGSDNSSWRHNFADFDKTLAGLSKAYPTIMMCHDPSNWDLHINGKRNVDLMLSGHTHGGQFGYNVFGYDLSPVRMFYKQWAGLYKSKDQYLYVNRGLGVVGPPVRIGINPEITHIVLRSPVNTASL